MISFVITTCGRLDLLKRTLDSFYDPLYINEYFLSDDTDDYENTSKIYLEYSTLFDKIITNYPKKGLAASIDNLYKEVNNKFIFHCEEDWEFDCNKNPNFMEDSLSILIENPDIHQVWIRHQEDNPHKSTGEVITTSTGVEYYLIDPDFNGWNGYSWNPGLRRKEDYLEMFPNGVSEFGDEYKCAQHSKNFNYKTVVLKNTVCKHIGHERTKNFKI